MGDWNHDEVLIIYYTFTLESLGFKMFFHIVIVEFDSKFDVCVLYCPVLYCSTQIIMRYVQSLNLNNIK